MADFDNRRIGALLLAWQNLQSPSQKTAAIGPILGKGLSGVLNAIMLLGMAQMGWESFKSTKRGIRAIGEGDWKKAGAHGLRTAANLGAGVLLGAGGGSGASRVAKAAVNAPWWKNTLKGAGSLGAVIGLPLGADVLTAKADPQFFVNQKEGPARSLGATGSGTARTIPYIPWIGKALL